MDFLKRARRNEPAPEAVQLATTVEREHSVPESPFAEPAGDKDKRWIGYIDHIDRAVITGWAYDRNNVGHSVPIEAIASNGKRATVIASIFRKDVKDAGYGSGNYGFEIDVGKFGLKDETLIVRFAESKVEITTTPFSLEPQRALLDGMLPAAYTNAMRMLGLQLRDLHSEFQDGIEAR